MTYSDCNIRLFFVSVFIVGPFILSISTDWLCFDIVLGTGGYSGEQIHHRLCARAAYSWVEEGDS